MITSCHHRAPHRRGFTLVELLVAISVTAVIIVLLSQIFASTSAQWQAADQRIDAFREARTAVQIIARDLARAHTSADARMLMLSDVDPSKEFAKEVFAITPAPNSGKSDLCAVGYYSVWDDTSNTYTMKRLLRDSDAILPSLQTLDFPTMYTKGGAAEEDVASYVWDLKLYVGSGNEPIDVTSIPSTSWRWIEVRFKAMSPAAGRKLANLAIDESTWADPSDPLYKSAILPHEQQFVTRVTLQQNR